MTSLPWKPEDIDSAMHLREEISFQISRKATELRILNEKMKVAYDELNTFSYTVSHDLKNPLSSIKGFTELILLDDKTLSEDLKFMLSRVLANATKMEVMIREILSYSKAAAEAVVLRPVNMKEILEEIKQELIIGINHPGLEIHVGETPVVDADRMMIIQIFSNLMGNAVKYSSKLEKPVVSVWGEEIDEGIQYIVRDNGIGIMTCDYEKIFELFARTEHAEEFEGSGVGLAIVKKLINKHSGKIRVESEPGQGAAFIILFNK